MADARTLLRTFAAGAAAMYFLDPRLGKRRRAVARDKAAAGWNDLAHELDKARRDIAHRAEGAVAAATAVMHREHPDDARLAQRARSVIGRVVSHPHAIAVRAENGRVVLTGPILAAEVDDLLRRVKSVPGVQEVVNQLEAHERSENIPSLQGGVTRESRSELMQQNWTPALRVAAGVIGSAILASSSRSRGVRRVAGSAAGAALLARAIFNREFRQLAGVGGGPRAIEFEKAVHVYAPVDEVFSFWANYENFPRFMTHLKVVRDLGNRRSHWVAEGPAGIPVAWDAELISNIPDKLLVWRSLPGSVVESEGVVRFDEEPDGSTRVGIRVRYNPPAGVLGHTVASLFGADPKHEMDDDMVRFKSLIEDGKTRAHGREVTRAELSSPPPA